MLKPLTQLLLSLCRQATESRIILQCALLLSGREIFVASQPIPSVALLLWMSLRRPLYLGPWRLGWMFLLSRPEDSSLGRAGKGIAIAIRTQATAMNPLVFPPLVIAALSLNCARTANPALATSSTLGYGLAATSCCRSRSSSNSKSEYMS